MKAWAIKTPKGKLLADTVRAKRYEAQETMHTYTALWPRWYDRGYRCVRVEVKEVEDGIGKTSRTQRRIADCGYWLSFCLAIGCPRESLDKLETIYWQFAHCREPQDGQWWSRQLEKMK